MELVATDILSDVRELSTVLCVATLVVGVVLWLTGWWSHRFWVVLAFTVLGGIYGLQNAPALLTQPLIAAIGVGLAAGILALTLVRLGAFAAGGYAGLLVLHAVFPTIDQPFLAFLGGAFFGFVLFRYWTMALTSFAGVVLMAHASLALAEKLGKIDAVSWSESNTTTINVVCGLSAFAGFLIQIFFDSRRGSGGGEAKDEKSSKKSKSDGILASGLSIFKRAA